MNPREHLDREIGRLRWLTLRFIRRAASLRWLPAHHLSGTWPWPTLADVTAALAPAPDLEVTSDDQVTGHIQASELTLHHELERYPRAAHLPLPQLAGAFGLNRHELDVLVLAIACEHDRPIRAALQLWRRDGAAKVADVEFLTLVLDEAAVQGVQLSRAFDRNAALLRHALLEHAFEGAGTAALVWVPRSVVRFLLGDPVADALGSAVTFEATPADPLAHVPNEVAPWAFKHLLAHAVAPQPSHSTAFYLQGPPGSGRRRIVRAVAARSGRPLLTVDLAELAQQGDKIVPTLARLRRDALLTGALVQIAGFSQKGREAQVASEGEPNPLARDDDLAGETWQLVARELALDPPLVVLIDAGQGRHFAASRRLSGATLAGLAPAKATKLVRDVLVQSGIDEADTIDLPASLCQSERTAGELVVLARQAVLRAELRAKDSVVERSLVLAALAEQGQHGDRQALTEPLQEWAKRSTSVYGWQDLVVPDAVLAQVQAVVEFARHRQRVFGQWRFAEKMPEGGALTVLLSGPSGVGKTTAAKVLASQLDRPLYQVELGHVLSRYVGTTEKRLAELFAAAQAQHAVLLFDEADALFGMRTALTSSADRYANSTVSFLLQCLESFEGAAILTTNHLRLLDPALAARMRFRIAFPHPDERARTRLWQTLLPPEAPLERGLDCQALARAFPDLSGANIRNAILRAALRAAAADRPIGMAELREAATDESDSDDRKGSGELFSRLQGE